MTEQRRIDEMESALSLGKAALDPATGKPDEFLTDETFSYAGYQITREEFFAHAREPSLSIFNNKLYVNKVCLRKAPDTMRVLIMVSPEQKKIILKPCSEEMKDSVPWVTASGNVRQVVCKTAFCALITELTGWNLNHRYKMIGKMVRNQGERLFVFDLNAAMVYPRKSTLDENGRVTPGRTSREPVYMESWRHQFGLPVEEHEQTYSINRFDDYVVISVQEKNSLPTMKPQLDRRETLECSSANQPQA